MHAWIEMHTFRRTEDSDSNLHQHYTVFSISFLGFYLRLSFLFTG